MLEAISIKNVKTLRDVKIHLGRMTVLAGPNGCGKTTALKAIELLSEVIRKDRSKVLVGESSPAVLRTHGSTDEITVRGDFSENDDSAYLVLTISDAPEDSEDNVRWTSEFESDLLKTRRRRGPAGSARASYSEFEKLAHEAKYLRFEIERLIAPSFAQGPDDRLDADGSNLASVLATVAATAPECFDDIHEKLRRIVPTIRRSRLEQVVRTVEEYVDNEPYSGQFDRTSKKEGGYQLRLELESGWIVPAHAVSEGTILTLGLLTLLLSSTRPDLILIDNLERGLHPRALRTLVEQLRAIQSQFPSLQIVATTHSPYLLDCFEPSEIRLMCLDESGDTVCDSIDKHQDFERWKDEMLPGEFWSMVGEDWLVKKAAGVGPQSA